MSIVLIALLATNLILMAWVYRLSRDYAESKNATAGMAVMLEYVLNEMGVDENEWQDKMKETIERKREKMAAAK